MYRCLLLLLFVFTALPATVNADVLTVRQKVIAPSGDEHIEVTALLAENEADRQKIVDYLVQTLEADRVANPQLLIGFEEIISDAGRSPSSVEKNPVSTSLEKIAGSQEIIRRKLDSKTRLALKARFNTWFEKNYRITFALTRGFINTGVTTWSLMASNDIPFPIALAAGTITGALSGSVQYWNGFFQQYLMKTIPARYIPGELLRAGVKKIEPFFRWYLLEIGFIAAIQVSLTTLGYGPEGTLGHIVQTNLITGLATVGAQGFWDVAVTKVTRAKLAEATSLLAKNRVQLRADLITLALSALSVSAMVGKLQHLEAANYVFGAMGTTGVLYFLKVWHSEWKCKRTLQKASPPRHDEEATIEVFIPLKLENQRFAAAFCHTPVWA